MSIVITKLSLELLKEKKTSFLDSLSELKGDIHTSCDTLCEIFCKNQDIETVFVAIDTESDTIIGSVRAIIDRKYIRWGSLAGRIEEIAIHKHYQGKWIGSQLVKEALQYFQEQWCYKVTLACADSLVGYYEKFGFTPQEIEMKIYLSTHHL